MSRYFIVCLFGLLFSILLAVEAAVCSEKETLLKTLPGSVTHLTECLMECTGMTYIKKLQQQDNHNIRLKDSTEGALGEYCWSTELKCTVGERFLHAFVVLPVDASLSAPELLQVTAPVPSAATLQAHSSPSTLPDNCGLRYDVTQHFSTAQTDTSFCVRVVAPEDALGDALGDKILKCPPFLVTFWQRNQAGDG